jgi:geranylgeranyl diphosphate synthase type II
MFDGNIHDALQPALAMEVFHNFTLLHDDIMDKAEKRRNMDCVHIKWNNNVAILSGDVMQILAYDLLKDLPDSLLKECLGLFSKTAMEVCEGHQFDMDYETQENVTEADYMEMIRLKTGVLLAASLKMGAIVGGAPKKDADLLYDFGIHIGLAFQLQDDILDVYGDAVTFGKNIGGDIQTNKKTFLLINALHEATGETRKELEKWLSKENFIHEDKIKAVTEIYNKTNVRSICQKEMERQLKLAFDSLDAINVPKENKKPLTNLANELMNRTH